MTEELRNRGNTERVTEEPMDAKPSSPSIMELLRRLVLEGEIEETGRHAEDITPPEADDSSPGQPLTPQALAHYMEFSMTSADVRTVGHVLECCANAINDDDATRFSASSEAGRELMLKAAQRMYRIYGWDLLHYCCLCGEEFILDLTKNVIDRFWEEGGRGDDVYFDTCPDCEEEV